MVNKDALPDPADYLTARTWLQVADFDRIDPDLWGSLVQRIGNDKACEVRAAIKRIAENMLDALGNLKLSEESMLRLMQTISSVALDNYAPLDRR